MTLLQAIAIALLTVSPQDTTHRKAATNYDTSKMSLEEKSKWCKDMVLKMSNEVKELKKK